MTSEAGQATVEWTGVTLLVALVLSAAMAFIPAIDGRSFGSLLGHAIVCAVRGRCDDGNRALAAAYGPADAALLRRFAPNIVYEPGTHTLPVDFRRCRSHHCSDAPDDKSLDTARSSGGTPAAAFTYVVHRGAETPSSTGSTRTPIPPSVDRCRNLALDRIHAAEARLAIAACTAALVSSSLPKRTELGARANCEGIAIEAALSLPGRATRSAANQSSCDSRQENSTGLPQKGDSAQP
jgi:hypothetical protein